MPKKVYCNVEKCRVLDGDREIEDVTKIGLPTIEHPTTEIKSAGIVMDIKMPDTTHLNSMEMTLYHNNGINCKYLSTPGVHNIECRIARQGYQVQKGDIGHEGAKFRFKCAHVSSKKGDIETGNPYGTTETYSVIAYEEEQDGKVVTKVDAVAGVLKWNGKDYASDVDKLLN